MCETSSLLSLDQMIMPTCYARTLAVMHELHAFNPGSRPRKALLDLVGPHRARQAANCEYMAPKSSKIKAKVILY